MRKSRRLLATACALAATTAFGAIAGDQHFDGSGFAVSGVDVVAHVDKEQAPVGGAQTAPTQGSADITAEHDGATFASAPEADRARFLAEPARGAPHGDGHIPDAEANRPGIDPDPASTGPAPQLAVGPAPLSN